MTYRRVIPRDLFNEANLLKCYGQLWLKLEGWTTRAVLSEDVSGRFMVEQDPSSGALEVVNLRFSIGREAYRLTRPLNARSAWPLYAETDDLSVAVFDDDGELSDEFRDLIGLEYRP